MAVPVSMSGGAVAETPKPSRGGHETARVASGFLAPSLLGLLAFTAFPIVASLLLGFFNWPVIGDPSSPAWRTTRRC